MATFSPKPMSSSLSSSPNSTSLVPITIRCHCRTIDYTYHVPASGISSMICHCGDCRYGTGMLYTSFTVIPQSSSQTSSQDGTGDSNNTTASSHHTDAQPSILSRLTTYRPSSIARMYFCQTCGATACLIYPGACEWSTGLVGLGGDDNSSNNNHNDRHSTYALTSSRSTSSFSSSSSSSLSSFSSSSNPDNPTTATSTTTTTNNHHNTAPHLEPLRRTQIFVGPTLDGGAAVWLPKQIGGREVKRYLGKPDGGEVSDELFARMGRAVSASADADFLPAKCLCGRVKFVIKRAAEGEDVDDGGVLVAGLKTLRRGGSRETKDGEKKKGNAAAATNTEVAGSLSSPSPSSSSSSTRWKKPRYRARLCMCRSCQLCTGLEASAWARIPAKNVLQADGRPYDADNGALGHYQSSRGVHRHFCKSCGAKTFVRKGGSFARTWDVAVGLFHDATVRVEGWFDWQDTIDHAEDGRDVVFVEALANGLKERKRADG